MKNKFFPVLFFLWTSIALGQVEPQVDLATGTMNLTIPLWNIQDRDLQFPLSLSYTANGVRIPDVPGWLGQNWSLSVEAAVYRTVRGLPDDFQGTGSDTRKGWLHGDMGTRIKNFVVSTDSDPNTCADEASNWTFLNGFGYNEDTEPDVFNVNAFGLSLQFYFDENKQIQIVSYSDIQIDTLQDITTGLIKGFSIVDEAGVKYVFEDGEKIQEHIESAPLKEYYFKRQSELYSDTTAYFNAWKISKIISPLYGVIDFTYKEIFVDNPDKAPTDRELIDENRSGYLSALSVKHVYNNTTEDVLTYNRTFTRKVLQKISSSTTDLEFTTVPRAADGTQEERLDEIKIFEKRLPERKFVKSIEFQYNEFYTYEPTDEITWYETVTDVRSFLESVTEKTATQSMPPYAFEYYGVEDDEIILPRPGDTGKQDNWGFYRQSAATGSLRKFVAPKGAVSVFFYEPHVFASTTGLVTKGGGMRIRKIITHAGIDSQSDNVREFEYLNATGETSGKLLSNPSHDLNTVKANSINGDNDVSYRLMQLQQGGGSVKEYFEVNANYDLSSSEMVNGSCIAYERVTVKQPGTGRAVYEFELPAMYGETDANNGEWQASTVELARTTTGGSGCYESGEIPTGLNVFPFPPNPNYNYARALLKKVLELNEDSLAVKETSYEYQRLLRNGTVKKIFGLAFEELPTYYYNGSEEVNSKMFLFSRYPVHTNVKTVLKKETVKLYNLPSQTDNLEHSISYYYESANHPNVTKVVAVNSDHSQLITTYKYAKDFIVETPADNASSGIDGLLTGNRNDVIEAVTSRVTDGVEKWINGHLSIYEVAGDKVLPYQEYILQSANGLNSFTSSSIVTSAGNSTFQYDTNYRLNNTFLGYDEKGNLVESTGIDRQVKSAAYGYDHTLPVLILNNCTLNETGFSDFETSTGVEFTTWPSPSFSSGRTGEKSLVVPGGDGYKIIRTLNGERLHYKFSCWIKAGSVGDLKINLKNNGADIVTPIVYPYSSDADWKYVTVLLTLPNGTSTFSIELSTTSSVSMDDIVIYPPDADLQMYTYSIPFGKATETDGRGVTTYYTYDEWGRLELIRDHNQNIVQRNTYQIRP